MIRFNVLATEKTAASLLNIATKDVATGSIQEYLLNARSLGLSQIADFVDSRLTSTASGKTKVKFRDPMKNKQTTNIPSTVQSSKG